MRNYTIKITLIEKTIDVEANNLKEAKEKAIENANNAISNSDYKLEAEEYKP